MILIRYIISLHCAVNSALVDWLNGSIVVDQRFAFVVRKFTKFPKLKIYTLRNNKFVIKLNHFINLNKINIIIFT